VIVYLDHIFYSTCMMFDNTNTVLISATADQIDLST
jgi:hypothetical protein